MSTSTKKISDNIYLYCLLHCANCGPQVKGVGFDQYSSTILSAPTLRLIIAIAYIYHLNIGIANVTNAFQNTLKASSELKVIEFTPHYLSWFKLHFSTICI